MEVDIFSAEALTTPILTLVEAAMSSDNIGEASLRSTASEVADKWSTEGHLVDNRSSSTTMDADGNPRDLMGILDDLERELHSGSSQNTPTEGPRTQGRCAGQEEEKHDDGPTLRPTNVEQAFASLQMAAIDKDKEVHGAQSFLANVSMDCVSSCEQVNTQTLAEDHNDVARRSFHPQRLLEQVMEDDFPKYTLLTLNSDWSNSDSSDAAGSDRLLQGSHPGLLAP